MQSANMKTITFYSYKGGVGRSLALSNIADRLSRFGKKVCMIDFDLDAPGLHLKFESGIADGVSRGLVDYIYDYSKTNNVPEDIMDYVTEIRFRDESSRANLFLIAAGNTQSKGYWRKLSAIDWNHLFYRKRSSGIEFFLNLKFQIHAQLQPDYLLVDSRTGITDISGITMSIFADEVVLLAANNKENLEGIAQVMRSLVNPSNSVNNRIPKMNFILCRIPYFFDAKDKPREISVKNAAQKYLNDKLIEHRIAEFKIDKVMVIHSDPELELQEKFKISYGGERLDENTKVPVGLDYLELFEELTENDFSPEEREKLNNFVEAELLIEKSLATKDLLARIKGLKAALKLNPKSAFGNFRLALTYFDIEQFEKALEPIEQYINLSAENDTSGYQLKTLLHLNLNQFKEAEECLKTMLSKKPDNHFALQRLAILKYRKGDVSKALELQETNVKSHPESIMAWNDYANSLRVSGRLEEARAAIDKAFEKDPQNYYVIGTLAEIYAASGDLREFYKNLELSFSLGMSNEKFQDIINSENIYHQFKNDEKFKGVLNKYDIKVHFPTDLHSL
jgi:tetratricopeptide (TPR) repeat protein